MDIDLTIKNYRCFSDEKPAHITLRKGFTAFVGPNNSGKSSLLKFFFEFRSIFSLLGNAAEYAQAMNNPRAFSLARGVDDPNAIFSNRNDRPLSIQVRIDGSPESGVPLLTDLSLVIPRGQNLFRMLPITPGVEIAHGQSAAAAGPIIVENTKPLFDTTKMVTAMNALSQTVYIGAFRNILNLSTRQDYFDIQVGEAFVKQWKSTKSGPIKAANNSAYRVEQDVRRIFGYSEIQINPASDDQTLRLIIDGQSYGLPELGSGIAQFILALANVAERRPYYVLIDEPELNLHPSLQLDFLTTLGSYAREGLLFATHSVGLARSSAQQVYSLQKRRGEPSSLTIFESTPRLGEFLGELSFFAYKELGFDKVLLVEGTTEVLTIQQFLRVFGKDHEVVILHLGGSSLINGSQITKIQLQEIKRISDKVFAIIDSEKNSAVTPLPNDRIAFLNACQEVEIKCHVLERRATENYLSDTAIKAVKGDKHRSLGEFEVLKSVTPRWAKSENWLIAREMSKADIESTDLGQFLATM